MCVGGGDTGTVKVVGGGRGEGPEALSWGGGVRVGGGLRNCPGVCL